MKTLNLTGATFDTNTDRLLTCWICRLKMKPGPAAAKNKILSVYIEDEHMISGAVICPSCWMTVGNEVKTLQREQESSVRRKGEIETLAVVASWGASLGFNCGDSACRDGCPFSPTCGSLCDQCGAMVVDCECPERPWSA